MFAADGRDARPRISSSTTFSCAARRASPARAQQQRAQQLLLVSHGDEVSSLRTDFEDAHGKGADSATTPAAFAAGSLDFQSAAARAAAKAISDLGHWNNGLVARDDRFSEHAFDLGAGGKALMQ